MKVVFVNRFFFPDHSATSQMLSDLAFFMSEEGREVHVITSRLRYDSTAARLPALETTRGVAVHRVWTSRFGRHFLPGRAIDYLTFYFSAAWRLWRLARAGDTVVAKTDPPMIAVVAGWVARLRGARLVNWLQDLFPEVASGLGVRGFDGWFGRWLLRLRNSSLQRADVNVVLGERMRERLLGEGVEADRVRVIHNWADGGALRLKADERLKVKGQRLKIKDEGLKIMGRRRDPLREEWGLVGKFVVGYSGNLGRAHEFETILGAAERLKTESDVVFLFIGGGAHIGRIKEEGARRGLDNLVFKPYQPRGLLGQSLGVSDVHLVVLRPELEGLIVPSKFYGIAAAGRPTLFVGDPDGEIPRILRAGECGISVVMGDSDDLAKQIQQLKTDPQLVARMGGNARRIFDEKFSAQRAFREWDGILGISDEVSH